MKNIIAAAALSAALLANAPAFANDAEILRIQNFIGTVNITTIGPEITVDGHAPGTLTRGLTRTLIDGQETIEPASCKSSNGNISLDFGGRSWRKRFGGYKDLEDYPVLTVTVPKGTALEIRDSVIFGDGESFGSVDAHIQSCGDFNVGDIDGPLLLKVSGSGDFEAGNVGTASIVISGSGDAEIGDMKTAVLKVTGSGDIDGGNIVGAAKITSTGSGNIELGEMTGDLVYEGRGSSNLSLDALIGRASVTVSGSSNTDIDDGEIEDLMISARGSSVFDFGGKASGVTLTASGSSAVDIDEAEGKPGVKVAGSASVEIGGTRYHD